MSTVRNRGSQNIESYSGGDLFYDCGRRTQKARDLLTFHCLSGVGLKSDPVGCCCAARSLVFDDFFSLTIFSITMYSLLPKMANSCEPAVFAIFPCCLIGLFTTTSLRLDSLSIGDALNFIHRVFFALPTLVLFSNTFRVTAADSAVGCFFLAASTITGFVPNHSAKLQNSSAAEAGFSIPPDFRIQIEQTHP